MYDSLSWSCSENIEDKRLFNVFDVTAAEVVIVKVIKVLRYQRFPPILMISGKAIRHW